MPDITILHEMIREAAKIPLVDGKDSKKQVTLTEPKQGQKSSVIICGIPDNTIVIRADVFKSPDTVFNSSRGECKRADFAIITDADNKRFIIYIELKDTNKAQEQEIIQQLRGAKCFVAYCREIGRAFWNQQNFLEGYKEHFVSFKNISISKRSSRNSRIIYDSPDNMLKLSLRSCCLSKLIGEKIR